MAAVIRTNLATIFRAIKAQIIRVTGWPAARVHFALRMNPPVHTQADEYALILPLTQSRDASLSDGGGRYSTVIRGRMNVYIRSRALLDEAYQDDEWLVGETNDAEDDGSPDPVGMMGKLDLIYDALEQFLPEDEDANILLVEPMNQIFTGEPHKNYQANEWGDVVTEWEVTYWKDYTLPEA